MDQVIARYFDAWNERDADERHRLLADCLTDDVELVDPVGRAQGHDGLSARIGQYQVDAPDTEIVPASGVDAHNDVVRYAWKIVGTEGNVVMEGLDVVQRADDGRLARIVMFHGPLPPS